MPIPSAPPIAMVFAQNLATVFAANLVRPLLVVTKPRKPDNFNNFGYIFQCGCYFLPASGDTVTIETALMFAERPDSSAAISDFLEGRPGWIDANEVTAPFCSLMYREDSYRALMVAVGLELGASILRRLRDAVFLSIEGGDAADVALIESDAFYLSMLRDDQRWTAFRRGARHLRYSPVPAVEDAASSFCMKVDLPSAENPYIVDFDFGSDRLIRDRFGVLIGKNGAGKSQILLSIVDGLANNPAVCLVPRKRRVRFLNRKGGSLKFGPPHFSRIVVFSSTPSDRYPPTIDPWLGIDYQYFAMTQPAVSAYDGVTVSIVDCMRDDFRVFFPVPGQRDVLGVTAGGRFELLKHVLSPLGLWTLVHLPLKDSAESEPFTELNWQGRRYISADRRFNEQRKLRLYRQLDLSASPVLFDQTTREPRHLSSGEAAMFRFAAQATAAAEMGTLFLFDEPETHLHPHFVSEFTEILHLLLMATKSVAIAATHSPHLVREAPSRRVRTLQIEDRIVRVEQPRIQTFGASIDAISRAVFGDLDVGHQYQATLRRWVESLGPETTIERVVAEFGEDLNAESLAYLRRLIEKRGSDGP